MPATRRNTLAGLAALGAITVLSPRALAEEAPLSGTWWGTLQVGTSALRLQLETGAGNEAVVISLDQGMARIPATVSRTADGDFLIEAQTVSAVYRARLTADGGLQGTFAQGGQNFTLAMQRGAAPAADQPILETRAMSAAELHRLRTELGTPGMAAAWRRTNGTAVLIADGLRSSGASRTVTIRDQWHIGSITKSMTALIAARAVEAGVLGWDTTIAAVLGPDMPMMQSGYANATLLHLLSHRSGLATSAGPERLADFGQRPGANIREERLAFVRAALATAPQAEPGAAMAYANAGYVTVGAMLEKRTGKSWEQLIQTYVFAPLRLASAGIGLPGHPGRIDQPVSHVAGPGGMRIPHFTDLPAAMGPAGLVHISPADMLAYLAAHRDRPERLLRRENWDRLHTPPYGGTYALGWVVPEAGKLFHNGSNGYWFATVGIDRGTGSLVALTANDASAIGQDERILSSLLKAAVS